MGGHPDRRAAGGRGNAFCHAAWSENVWACASAADSMRSSNPESRMLPRSLAMAAIIRVFVNLLLMLLAVITLNGVALG